MAYLDPQSVTIDGTAISLPRVLTGTTVGRFVSADAVNELTIDPRGSAKRRRNVARLYSKRTAVDPQVPTATIPVQSMVSITIDRPSAGVTDAEIEKDLLGLLAWLTASTNANLKKLVAGEN
jgi:hypothetical protein